MANGFLSGKYNAQSVFEKNTDYRSIMPLFVPLRSVQSQCPLDLCSVPLYFPLSEFVNTHGTI